MEKKIQGAFKVNEDEKQFELHVDSHIATLEYFREGDKLYLTHTETPVLLRGRGVGGELVKLSLQCAKENGFIVVPQCSYVAHYIDGHPEWRDILSDGYQM